MAHYEPSPSERVVIIDADRRGTQLAESILLKSGRFIVDVCNDKARADELVSEVEHGKIEPEPTAYVLGGNLGESDRDGQELFERLDALGLSKLVIDIATEPIPGARKRVGKLPGGENVFAIIDEVLDQQLRDADPTAD